MTNQYNIIDLFSGAGGLTEGFRTSSFNIVGHVEKEAAASQTLRLRDAYYYLREHNDLDLYYQFLSEEITETELLSYIPNDILSRTINKEIGEDTLEDIFETFSTQLNGENVTGVIGGPPCQAYSTMGRAQNAHKKATDGRIYLYRYYIDFLTKYSPSFFVFENVKGLLSFEDVDGQKLFPKMQDEFRSAGYELDYQVVNTAEYGVPQKRERIIIFGTKNNNASLISQFFTELNALKEEVVTVKQALEDLPFLNNGQQVNNYKSKPNAYISKYLRTNSKIPLTQNLSRPNLERDLFIYSAVAKERAKGNKLKYSDLKNYPGMKKEYLTHKHQDKFLDRFKALAWDEPSHTIVAHISRDGHHYIHPDVKQNRSITLREAARIQSFPDDFYFLPSRTQAFIQIGNAVPPVLGKKIANAIEKLNF